MNHHSHYQSLWRWICVRILTLAIGSVVVIALCMWLRFVIENLWVLHHMSPALRAEFYVLRDNPDLNLARFHEIVDQGWGRVTPIPPSPRPTGSWLASWSSW